MVRCFCINDKTITLIKYNLVYCRVSLSLGQLYCIIFKVYFLCRDIDVLETSTNDFGTINILCTLQAFNCEGKDLLL